MKNLLSARPRQKPKRGNVKERRFNFASVISGPVVRQKVMVGSLRQNQNRAVHHTMAREQRYVKRPKRNTAVQSTSLVTPRDTQFPIAIIV